MANVGAWVWSGNAAKLLADNILVGATTVSATELSYLSGVTSNIQTQLNGKQPTISLAGNRALATSAGGGLQVSVTTRAELDLLSGVTSNVQAQINSKLALAGGTLTGALTINTASNQLVLGSGVNALTVNGGTSAAARTYTVPDVGTTANFVMTAGAQTIAGAKTLTSGLDIQFGGSSLVIGADLNASTRTDATRKYAYISVPQYTNAEENVLFAQVETDTAFNVIRWGGGDSNYNAATEHRWYTAANATTVTGTERMRLTSAGNLGIGTTPNSLSRLHIVEGTNYALRIENTDAGGGYWHIGQSDNAFASGGGKLLFIPDANSSASATVVFSNTGAVTLGPNTVTPYNGFHTTNRNISSGTPDTATDLKGGWAIAANAFWVTNYLPTRLTGLTGPRIGLLPRTSNTAASFVFACNQTSDAASGVSGLQIGSATAAGEWTLGPNGYNGRHVSNGELYSTLGFMVGVVSNNNKIDDASGGTGSATLYIGNQTINTTSDRRVKAEIVDSELNALDAFCKMRVVDHMWNDPTDVSENNRNARGKWTGIIAQEAIEHLPFIINAPRKDGTIDHESGDVWKLDHGAAIGPIIKAIQELNAKIEALGA